MIEFRWIALIDFTTTESEMVKSMKDKSVAAMHEYKLKTIPQIIENKTFFIAWKNEFYFLFKKSWKGKSSFKYFYKNFESL